MFFITCVDKDDVFHRKKKTILLCEGSYIANTAWKIKTHYRRSKQSPYKYFQLKRRRGGTKSPESIFQFRLPPFIRKLVKELIFNIPAVNTTTTLPPQPPRIPWLAFTVSVDYFQSRAIGKKLILETKTYFVVAAAAITKWNVPQIVLVEVRLNCRRLNSIRTRTSVPNPNNAHIHTWAPYFVNEFRKTEVVEREHTQNFDLMLATTRADQ